MPADWVTAPLSPHDTITLGAVVSAAEQELSELDLARSRVHGHTMPFIGPASLLAVAARTLLPDAPAAENYLARLRRSGAWIDQLTERLRAGAAKGRLPVAHLSEAAIDWTSTIVADTGARGTARPPTTTGWERRGGVGHRARRGGRGGRPSRPHPLVGTGAGPPPAVPIDRRGRPRPPAGWFRRLRRAPLSSTPHCL